MEDFKNFGCYYDFEKQTAVRNLFAFGAEHFYSAYLIKELPTLKEYVQKLSNGEDVDRDIISEFLFSHLTDNIKISICFENYAKAKLLEQGYVVHNIKGKGAQGRKKLQEDQKKRPITVNELMTELKGEGKQYLSDGLLETTLSYGSVILDNPLYTQTVGFSISMTDLLTAINSERNKLHFLHSWSFELRLSNILKLEELKNNMDRIWQQQRVAI